LSIVLYDVFIKIYSLTKNKKREINILDKEPLFAYNCIITDTVVGKPNANCSAVLKSYNGGSRAPALQTDKGNQIFGKEAHMKNKFLAIILSIALLAAMIPQVIIPAFAGDTPMLGDVNGDGVITVSDALMALQASAQKRTLNK